MSSEDYGRDLTGVQNLRKKHKRLEAELGAHEPAIQVLGGLGSLAVAMVARVVPNHRVSLSRCWTLGRSCLMTTPSDRRRSSRGWPSSWTTGRSSKTCLEPGEPGDPAWRPGASADCGAVSRGRRLEESLEYQQFVANVEEEEAWINEKLNLVGSEDYGDTLAAVQVRL